MSETLHLTLACGDYEIIRALKEGTVKADGIDLTVLTDMDSSTRHWRMVRNQDFDVCEFSWSTYLMAKDRQDPLTAIPVFLHRRFRHGFVFINSGKGISKPTDLIGKDVGLKTFQATALVWIRGILEEEFQVPVKKVNWKAEKEEDVPFIPPPGLSLERTPKGKRVESMLTEGELDAVIHPDVLSPIMDRDPRVKRLFKNSKELEVDYYRRTGIFPIMHTTAIKQEIVDRHPWVPMNLLVAFERAKNIAYQRMENPRRVPLAWFRDAQEEQEEIMGRDPWVYGLNAANRKNVGALIRYSHQQGMISRELSVDELFDRSVLGEEWKLPLSRA
ncbi:MAG: ABC transporter substrate-binding protein [Candidatus Binatia bacterium]|nr:ABC transporter substrate-binding protein [Candidatus Binatia bacterium]